MWDLYSRFRVIPRPLARFLLSFLSLLAGSSVLLAHEPLFMASHEAPGKGALDLHLEVTGERTEDEDETEYELEATWGVTRDVAVRVGLPFVTMSGGAQDGASLSTSGFGDPTVQVKWRFWDHDLLRGKYAVAALLSSTIPVGEEGLGRDRPSLLAGIAHGREGLKHYYFHPSTLPRGIQRRKLLDTRRHHSRGLLNTLVSQNR